MSERKVSPIALSFKGVTRRERGATDPLIREISFEVKTGTLVALVGADGAGKTTLMRAAAGLLKPQAGEVLLFGENLYQNLSRLQAQCGYMPQQFGLYTDLSVRENLLLYADLFGLDEKAREIRFKELLSMTGLAPFTERLAGKLSGGMKQKLGLACALLNRPKLLLLDEPSVGVDPLSRRELWRVLIESVRKEAMTVVVATTYMDEASLCDQVLVLEDGKLVLSDTPQAIAEHARGLVFSLKPQKGEKVRDLQAQLLDQTERVLDAVPEAGSVRVLLREGAQKGVLQERLKRTLSELQPRLEDGYLVLRSQNEEKRTYSVIHSTAVQSSSAKALVRARDLVRRFGDFLAVDRTSFEVYPGEIFGLLGPNGAGKSTTIKSIVNLLSYNGEILICGYPNNSLEAKKQFGYIPEVPVLYDLLTVDESIEFIGKAYRLENYKETGNKYLELFQLTQQRHKLAKELSKGMKQKLSMILALLIQPKALLVDEPMVGLDPASIEEVLNLLVELKNQGTSILISTHIIDVVNEIWDCAYIMNHGEIIRRIHRGEEGSETLKQIFFEATAEEQ